jgi:hypothetical protein
MIKGQNKAFVKTKSTVELPLTSTVFALNHRTLTSYFPSSQIFVPVARLSDPAIWFGTLLSS